MSALPKPDLLDGLDHLIGIFAPFTTGSEAVEISTNDLRTVLAQLRHLRHLAFLNERELGGFRTLEADRFKKGTMEEVATGTMGELLLDREGNVIRADFGGKS